MLINDLKDVEKSLKSKCLTRTYKKNKSCYMNFKRHEEISLKKKFYLDFYIRKQVILNELYT